MQLIRRWLGPALIALLVMLGYQFFVSAVVRDVLDDWAFLHYARLSAIQQQQQRAAPK